MRYHYMHDLHTDMRCHLSYKLRDYHKEYTTTVVDTCRALSLGRAMECAGMCMMIGTITSKQYEKITDWIGGWQRNQN